MKTSLAMDADGLVASDAGMLESAWIIRAFGSADVLEMLPVEAAGMIQGSAAVLHPLLRSAVEAKTAAEFDECYRDARSKYMVMNLAWAQVAQATVPPDGIEALTLHAIRAWETGFLEGVGSSFGPAVGDEVTFTVWTLRKIHTLSGQISPMRGEGQPVREDRGFYRQFIASFLPAGFALECLATALRLQHAVHAEVLEELRLLLRSMVNAYAWARRRMDLRNPPPAPSTNLPETSDEEDEQLLSASMRDLARIHDDFDDR